MQSNVAMHRRGGLVGMKSQGESRVLPCKLVPLTTAEEDDNGGNADDTKECADGER